MMLETASSGFAWGNNNYGKLGDNSYLARFTPVDICGDLKFIFIKAADNHTVALSEDGDAYAWGANDSGQIGNNTSGTNEISPVMVSGGLKFKNIVPTDGRSTIGLTTDGVAYVWGYNNFGQLGNGTSENISSPVVVNTDLRFTSIDAGTNHFIALTENGDVYTWGQNTNGQLGDGTTTNRTSPVLINEGLKFTSVHAGGSNSFAMAEDGTLYGWGGNNSGSLGNNSNESESSPVVAAGGMIFSSVFIGDYHNFALTSNGGLYGWGANWFGMIGNGSDDDCYTPVSIDDIQDCVMAAPGEYHSLFLIENGDIYSCGWNYYGALGIKGRDEDYDTAFPELVIADVDFKMVTAGSYNSLALGDAIDTSEKPASLQRSTKQEVCITCYNKDTPTDPEDYTVEMWNDNEWVEITNNPLLISPGIIKVDLTEDETNREVVSIRVVSSNLENQIAHFSMNNLWTGRRASYLDVDINSIAKSKEYDDKMNLLDRRLSSRSTFNFNEDVVRAVDHEGDPFTPDEDVRDAIINADLSDYEETSADGTALGDLIVSTRSGVVGRMKINDKIVTFYSVDGVTPLFTATLDNALAPTSRGGPTKA